VKATLRSHIDSLPAYTMEKELVETIQAHQITVVAGATGCGKVSVRYC
jgi:HrpA-like RNA helicase